MGARRVQLIVRGFDRVPGCDWTRCCEVQSRYIPHMLLLPELSSCVCQSAITFEAPERVELTEGRGRSKFPTVSPCAAPPNLFVAS